mgnify:CR=1 FL=1
MRKIFWNSLIKLAEKDKDIILLTDDLGYGYYDEFISRFPKQLINCGITEQSMIGIAAGLVRAGKKPYCYGTIPFVLMRPYEQIRDDVAYPNLNVKIIGYSMPGFLGFAHNLEGTENEEDLLKNLPNIKVFKPTKETLEQIMFDSYLTKIPAYIHL